MRMFCLNEQEIKDLLVALKFYVDYVHMEDDSYDRAEALINRLTPKEEE